MFRRFHFVAMLIWVLIAAPALAQDKTDRLGVPGPLKVGGESYTLVWSSQPTADYFKQQYLPSGQKLESYKSMVIVEFLATDRPMAEVVAAQTNMIRERKAGNDPVANFAVFENPSTGEVLLDFILSARDQRGEYIVEWNGYRYVEAEFKGRRGVLLFALSERAYGNQASEQFLRELATFKKARIQALTTASRPELK